MGMCFVWNGDVLVVVCVCYVRLGIVSEWEVLLIKVLQGRRKGFGGGAA